MAALAAALEIAIAPPEPHTGSLRVLLVDGDDRSRTMISNLLAQVDDVDVFAFQSAEQAFNVSSGDGYHLCLLDDCLAGCGGIMLGAMVRALNPAARMVLLTDAPTPQLEREALEHGFQEVLFKPVAAGELVRLLGQ